MGKTLVISIQIENVDLKKIADVEEAIQEALKEFENKRISYNIIDALVPPPAPR